MIEAFHHKSMRRILGISIKYVMEEEIKNAKVREWFGDAVKIEDVWRRRQLLFIGRIVRLDTSKYLPRILTSINAGKRCRGRPFRTIRDAFVDNLSSVILNLDKRGCTNEWMGYAMDESEWTKIVKRKERHKKGRFEGVR